MIKPILFDSHMHTPLCKHAVGEPEEYAATAIARNLRGVIFTCHNPAPGWAENVRMDPEEFGTYVEMIETARRKMEGRVEVLLGLESDFVPGMEAYLEKLHASAPLNYVLGSVHPQVAEYRERYYTGDMRAFVRGYFGHVAQAAQSALFDCLSHPDLVKNLFPSRWSVQDVLDDIRPNLDLIAKTGVCMELNTSGLQKSIPEMNPGPVMLREMCLRSIPVVVGSDSHDPERVGADFQLAFDQLEQAGYEDIHFFIERKRQTVKIADARKSLRST